MLRLLLPPNLDAAIPRNAIAVQVELDLSQAPPPALLPGLAVLQRLGVKPEKASLVQLNREQLRDLISALAGEPVFFLGSVPNVPMAWHGKRLSGVSELLDTSAALPHATGAKVATIRPALRLSRPLREESAAREEPAHTPLLIDGSEHFLAVSLPSKESAN